MKWAVLQSVCNNYESIISLTSPINKRYAEYHKADYILHKQKFNHDRYPAWNKIYSTLDVLYSGKYDYILFIDGDAVVVDITKNLFDLGFNDPNTLLHMCDDNQRKKKFNVNTGVYLVKCDDLMITFFEKVLHYPTLKRYYTVKYWEQNVTQHVLNRDKNYYSKIVKVYDGNYFNHTEGDWVYHPCIVIPEPMVPRTDEIKISLLKKKISTLTVDQKLYLNNEILSSDIQTLSSPSATVLSNQVREVRSQKLFLLDPSPGATVLSNMSSVADQPKKVTNITQQPKDYYD